MKLVLYILSAILIMGCNRSMIPVQTENVHDSIYTETTIEYLKDTVHLPGDTVRISKQIPCPGAILNERLKVGRTTGTVTLKNGQLDVVCQTDSFVHVIDSLKQIIKNTTRTQKTTKTVYVPVDVVKKKIPAWVWVLLLVNSAYIVGRITNKIRF